MLRRGILGDGPSRPVKPGQLSSQGKLVLAVIMVLVCVNLYFTLRSPNEKSLPRSVRMAQARADSESLVLQDKISKSLNGGGAGKVSKEKELGGGGSGTWWSTLTKPWRSSGKDAKGGGKKKPVAAKPSASPSRAPPPFDPVTHEHCFAQSDESETCFYHGATCYDGNHLIVVDPSEPKQDARTSMCYDFRHFVASPSCGYNGPHKRQNLPEDTPLSYLKDTAPRLLSYTATRSWGPQGRETHYRQVTPDVFENLNYNKELNVSFHWLDGPMYVGGLHHSWLDHTWHFAAATMALFDLKRYNRSAHIDYAGHAAQSRLQTVGAWEAPPMDYFLMAGDYRNVKDGKDLRPWIANLFNLLVQNHTTVLWNSVWKGAMGVGANKWLCSKQAVVIGLKPRMFNSIADAHVFRMMSYHYVGIKEPTKDEWPPRRITIITRVGTRNVVNIDDGVALIKSYGLEVNWITEMGVLTFEQQVEAMAKTGILLAIHGAGLANVLFMPAHSVVVEVSTTPRVTCVLSPTSPNPHKPQNFLRL